MSLYCMCGGSVTEKVTDYAADNVPAEITYECQKCHVKAFFAYGHYEDQYFPFTACPPNPQDQRADAPEKP